MSHQCKILTTLNQPLEVQLYSLGGALPQTYTTLEGVPIGTADNSATGELGAKVIVIGGSLTANPGGLVIPASDDLQISYITGTNNIDQVVFKKAGAIVATLQLSYLNAGAANDDLITQAQLI